MLFRQISKPFELMAEESQAREFERFSIKFYGETSCRAYSQLSSIMAVPFQCIEISKSVKSYSFTNSQRNDMKLTDDI